jgi:hypothetical protein
MMSHELKVLLRNYSTSTSESIDTLGNLEKIDLSLMKDYKEVYLQNFDVKTEEKKGRTCLSYCNFL